MKTENELIAEFMGGTFEKREIITIGGKREGKWTFHDGLWLYDDQLDYDKRWDRLMPVVEKIAELGFNTTWNYNCETQTRYFSIYDLPYRNTAKGMQFYAEGDNCMYNAVVKFIRWYTSKNS